jgi:hypothetical protein
MYTLDMEEMMPCRTLHIDGVPCTEVLYTFRCFPRATFTTSILLNMRVRMGPVPRHLVPPAAGQSYYILKMQFYVAGFFTNLDHDHYFFDGS